MGQARELRARGDSPDVFQQGRQLCGGDDLVQGDSRKVHLSSQSVISRHMFDGVVLAKLHGLGYSEEVIRGWLFVRHGFWSKSGLAHCVVWPSISVKSRMYSSVASAIGRTNLRTRALVILWYSASTLSRSGRSHEGMQSKHSCTDLHT